MKDKLEINEGDALIAKFMGSFQHPTNPEYMVFNPGGIPARKHKAEYHSNWSWLIPVVEKIESLKYDTVISCYTTVLDEQQY